MLTWRHPAMSKEREPVAIGGNAATAVGLR